MPVCEARGKAQPRRARHLTNAALAGMLTVAMVAGCSSSHGQTTKSSTTATRVTSTRRPSSTTTTTLSPQQQLAADKHAVAKTLEQAEAELRSALEGTAGAATTVLEYVTDQAKVETQQQLTYFADNHLKSKYSPEAKFTVGAVEVNGDTATAKSCEAIISTLTNASTGQAVSTYNETDQVTNTLTRDTTAPDGWVITRIAPVRRTAGLSGCIVGDWS